jgi:hypothetical protein
MITYEVYDMAILKIAEIKNSAFCFLGVICYMLYDIDNICDPRALSI